MLNFFISVFSISLLGTVLAALITLCHFFLSNYGDCKITINEKKELKVKGGESLLSSLIAEKIFIPSACGGRSSCGLCKVKVLDGGGELLPTEEPFISASERKNGFRLSCQVKLRRDIRISIPEELLSVREFISRCVRIKELTSDMRLFRFEILENDLMDYVPGQYIQLLAPRYEGSDEEVYRAYSIASDPSDKRGIELIIRFVPGGICTTYCFKFLKEGCLLRFNGPYGDFKISDTDSDMIFIAGGSGIAPIRCMLYEMKNKGIQRKAKFFFGANTIKDLCLLDEMEFFMRTISGFEFIPVVARPEDASWKGQVGLVTQAVDRLCSDLSKTEAYLCGSPGMIDASIKTLLGHGIKQENIFYDKFA